MRHPYLSVALKAIGILLFLWIVSRIDRSELAHTLQRIPITHCIGFLLLLFLGYVLKSWRWFVMTRAAAIPTSFREAFTVYSASLFLGLLTPGKLGEATKIPHLMQHGASLKKAVALTILDRLLDIMVIAVLGIASIGVLVSWSIASLVVIAILCGIAVTWYALRSTEIWRRAWDMKPALPYILLLSVLAWAVYFVQLIILRDAFDFAIPLLPFLSIMTIIGIINMLPIAPAGLGTRDAALLFFFAPFGIAAEQTVAFSFVIFALTMIGSLLGAYCLMHSPLLKHG